MSATVAASALSIDAAFGYPGVLFRRFRHPVVWMGALVAALDDRLNHGSDAKRRRSGIVAATVLLAISAGIAAACAALLPTILIPVLAAPLLAQRSLFDHVACVADGIERDGLAGGRRAVAHIVGRDPQSLDEFAVARAAIESLAENFSDAVVAPAFWCVIAGLPGIAAYKAVNTADSMIGHRTPRHAAFGWAAARLDDLVNLPASRLAAFWLVVAAALEPDASPLAAWRAVLRDAGSHRSPNAGWPEAAMAGALGLRLAGPRVYRGKRVEDGWMGAGRAEVTAADIRRALSLYRLACTLQTAAFALLAVTVRG